MGGVGVRVGEKDSATYVSSISTASMGLGGSMPRPGGGESGLINTRLRLKHTRSSRMEANYTHTSEDGGSTSGWFFSLKL